MENLRNRLNALKDKHGLSNQKWSDLSGVPLGTVSGILSGQTAAPSFTAVCDMVTSLGESVDELLGHEKPHAPADPDSAAPVVVAEHHHHFAFMPFRGDVVALAREAIAEVYASESHRSSRIDTWVWRVLALAETALIIGVLIFDITHPTMGYIQYDVAAAAGSAMDLVRRMV